MHAPRTEGEPLQVGYVLKRFPRLSETFILNEILGLEAAAVEVSVLSLRLPNDGRFHGELGRLRTRVEYLPSWSEESAYAAFASLAEAEGPGPRRLRAALRFLQRLRTRKRGALLVQALELAARVRRRGLHHLHAHFMTVASHVTHIAHLLGGVPYTVTAHAKDIFRETVDPALFRDVAAAASRIVTVSDDNRRFIAERFLDGDDSRVVRIYNGLPLTEIEPRHEPPRSDLVLAVGRLVEKKGFHVLLEACRLLAEAGEGVRVEILGEGPERARLLEARDRYGLEEVVALPGAQSREVVLQRMREARLLVAPSVRADDGNRDALPTVLIEALATGLPSVSTALGGIPEIVDDGREGLLVAPADALDLADAMHRLVHGDDLWRRLSAAGRRKAEERFDRTKTIRQLLDVFETSADRVPAAAGAPR